MRDPERYVYDPERDCYYLVIAGGTGFEEIAPIIAAVAAAASAGTGIASASGAFAPKTPKMPTAAPVDTSNLAKALIPSTNANAAANVGGGVAPDFIANLIGQQTGTPDAGLDIISSIRQSLGQQGP